MQGYPQDMISTTIQDGQDLHKDVNLKVELNKSDPQIDVETQQPQPEPSPKRKAQPQEKPSRDAGEAAALDEMPDYILDTPAWSRVVTEAESEPLSEPFKLTEVAYPSTTLAPDSESETPESEPGSEPGKLLMPEALRSSNFSMLRFRKSCYFEATMRWGVKGFIPYNHMLLPQRFSTVEDEYENLRTNVCIWDVSCERQIEVAGEDALQLVELLTPRKMGGPTGMKVGEARYCVMTDENGMVLNDPVVLKVRENRYWFSIADSDMLFWVKGMALGHGFNVKVSEADVSPLALQGPKSLALVRDLFGEWVDELKFYNFRETELDGIPVLLCRSGWSPERGYELFLKDCSRGDELWEKVMAAGQKYSIKPGAPNAIRRVEGGLLAFGNDITLKHNILELGLPPKWCCSDKSEFLGKAAIKSLLESGGPIQQVVGLELQACAEDDGDIGPFMKPWDVLAVDEAGDYTSVGWVSSIVFSPAMETHIAIATLKTPMCGAGTKVFIDTACGGRRSALVRKLPFMPRNETVWSDPTVKNNI